ncbi:MAG: hypothetical protein IT423_11325 [Pirellulaceae bacterium]|nr:hypothetical protein [Pirellulaceae bacterium]
MHGISLVAVGDEAQAMELLSSGASIENRSDYFMTSICLMALAAIESGQGKEASALNRLGDASLRAAQLEQADLLAESLAMIGQLACAARRTDLLPVLQAATVWSQKYAILPFMQGSAAVCELSVLSGNIPVHEAAAKQMLNLLRGQDRGQDVTLPRAQAQLGYAMARAAAAQNRLPLAEGQLETSMSMLRGSPLTGAATPRVFQTQLTLELLLQNKIAEADAERLFETLLQEPSSDQWRRWPLECMVSISSGHLPAYEKFVELAVKRQATSETVTRMSQQQMERYHEVLPLGGRLLAARQLMHSDKQTWPAETVATLEPLLKLFPAIRSMPLGMRETLEFLAREPMVIEDREISAESKKNFGELAKQSEAEENALMMLALQRIALPRHQPAPVGLDDVQQRLRSSDVLISFVHSPTNVYGAAISKTAHHVWVVPESPVLDAKIALLLTQIGLRGAPNLDVGMKAPWRTTASELSKLLLPEQARQMVAAGERTIIVPSGNLWYLPFDLLPLDADGRVPLLARHPTCYLPTLSHVRLLGSAAPTVRNTIGIYNSFFANERVANQTLCGQIGQGLPQSLRLDSQQKSGLSTPSWLRLRGDQIWVASELPMVKTPWELRVLPLEPSQENALANWMQSPLRGPSRLFLPGLQTGASIVEMKGGNELFIPACTFMVSGVRSTWMSRWKVGGRSTHTALGRLLDEMQYESPSSAWQRSAIALWAEKIPTAEEPVLPSAKSLPSTIDGSHPLLWSGYMVLGDHLAPE